MIMKLSNEGLRKAAILVASLDTAAADAVLDQLTTEQARQVREIVVEMDDVDQGEQRRVIDEFFQVGPKAPAKDSAGVELDGRLAWLTSRGGPMEPEDADRSAAPTGNPFRFLQETETEKLVRVLGSERPQTIALVLSHLSPVRAGAVLARLPEKTQVDVIHRLVDLEETDPEILREVEEALRSRLSQQVEMQRRRVAGLQAVAGILQATDGRVGMQILDNLASCDHALAEKLGPRTLTFNDLADLDETSLAAIFDEAGSELMLPALFGAVPELVSRVLAHIPQADAKSIRHKLDHPDPIRLSDVEEARRQVARIASRLNYCVTHSVVRAA
ncbi:MAG: FliG C-terminal domain-containing protein [Thermoguttaceae bacterium]|jgi:flagellar motor switch protein FliG